MHLTRSIAAVLGCALLFGLGACTNGALTPVGQQTVSNLIADGQLFCGVATQAGPVVVAVVDATSAKAVTVTDQAASYVNAACKIVNGIPVAPPVNAAAAPVVAIVPPAPTAVAAPAATRP